MSGMNTCSEIAAWLNNTDGNGAGDIEFAEVFALLDIARNGRGIPDCYDTYAMILRMDTNGLCEYLKAVLNEIQCIVSHKLEEDGGN